ncbi:MAG: VPS10 domain-containing protein [Bacteroidota bacterium]
MRSFVLLGMLLSATSSVLGQPNTWRAAIGPTYENAAAGFAIHPVGRDTVYAICADDLLRSTDRGETWDSLNNYGFSLGAIGISPINPQVMWVSTRGFTVPTGNNIHQSNDGGLTWDLIFMGSSYPVRAIHIDPGDPNTVYIGRGLRSFYRSSNLGQSWDTMLITNPGYAITSVAIAPSNNKVIYVGFTEKIVKSTDRGATWATLSTSFSFDILVRIVVHPDNADIVYAGVLSGPSGSKGIYKSTDGGTSWNEKNIGLGALDRDVYTFLINEERPDELYLGITWDGGESPLFRTVDGAESWHPYNTGLPIKSRIHSLTIDTLHERIYAGVSSADDPGIYFFDIVTSVDIEPDAAPERFALYQNYPNPFNPTSQIRFDLPEAANLSLVVYDILGREVAIIAGGYYDAGYHSADFDATALASGVYFYRLEAGTFVAQKKMILMK